MATKKVGRHNIQCRCNVCHIRIWLKLKHRIRLTSDSSQNITIKNNNDYLYGGQHAYQYAYSAI